MSSQLISSSFFVYNKMMVVLFLFCFCDLYKYDLVLNIHSPLPCEEICFLGGFFYLYPLNYVCFSCLVGIL